MNIQLQYRNESVSDYLSLIERYPESEFDSPYRSTIPLLCFWSNIQDQLDGFTRLLGLRPMSQVVACFEFGVDVQKGRGKPSQTDLMITSDNHAIAIEAKYTEPPYEKVNAWMGNSSNRMQVLEGWLHLICSAIGRNKINTQDVGDLPYQLIHRCASACYPNADSRALVYQCFDLDEKKALYYQSQLKSLYAILNKPDQLEFFLMNIPLIKSQACAELQNRWNSGEDEMHVGEEEMHVKVIRELKRNEFLSFGKPTIISIH
jgi:hypothetical protein